MGLFLLALGGIAKDFVQEKWQDGSIAGLANKGADILHSKYGDQKSGKMATVAKLAKQGAKSISTTHARQTQNTNHSLPPANNSYEYEEEIVEEVEEVEDAPPQVTANYKPVVIDSKEHETQTLQEVQSIIRRLKKWPELDASQFTLKPNAFATYAAAATLADGEVDESGTVVVYSFAEALGLNPKEIVETTHATIEKQRSMTLEDIDEKLESIAGALNPTKSVLLFTLCATIIVADEELSRKEKALLNAISAVLEINDTQKEKIFGIIEDVTGIIIKL